MLTSAKVIPLPQPQPQAREFKMRLGEGSVFVLTEDAPGAPGAPGAHGMPTVLRVYQLTEFSIAGSVVRWSVKDDQGRWFDGRHQEVRLTEDLSMNIELPLIVVADSSRLKTWFHIKLAGGYRLHHLSYLKQKFPHMTAVLGK